MTFNELDPALRSDLIQALNKRFPTLVERRAILQRTGLHWDESLSPKWSTILVHFGDDPSATYAILQAAAQLRPQDQTLQTIRDLLAPAPALRGATIQGFSMLLGAACAILLFWKTEYSIESLLEPQTQSVRTVERAPVKAPPKPPPAEPTPTPDPEPEPESTSSEMEAPIPTPVYEVLPDQQPPTPIPEVTPPAPLTPKEDDFTRCQLSGDGELIGYWYVGNQPINPTDGWLKMSTWRNVRADYPDKHNEYNARATVRCVLSPNTKVYLKNPPIAVPGGAYWVPLYGSMQG